MANYDDKATPNLNATITTAATLNNHSPPGINSTYRMKRKKFMSLTSAAVTLKSKLLKLSLTKLGQITDPEIKLRRCVLIYNAAKALKREIVALEEKRSAALNATCPPSPHSINGKKGHSAIKEEDALLKTYTALPISSAPTTVSTPPCLAKDQYRYSNSGVTYLFYPTSSNRNNYEPLDAQSYQIGASKNASTSASYSMLDFSKYSQHHSLTSPTSSPPLIANSPLESLKLFDF